MKPEGLTGQDDRTRTRHSSLSRARLIQYTPSILFMQKLLTFPSTKSYSHELKPIERGKQLFDFMFPPQCK
jgi:hypothetical protein